MKYKRLILTCCMLIGMAVSISAQESRRNTIQNIVFNNLTYQKQEEKATVMNVLGAIAEAVDAVNTKQTTLQRANYQKAVRAAIIKGISQSRRVALTDGTGMSSANYYVDGNISNISTTSKIEERTDSKGKKYNVTEYKATLGVILHIKSAETNQVVASPSFNISDYDLTWINTAEGALNDALSQLSTRVYKYFNKFLPLYANVLEGASEKKDKQKEVYIDLGSATKGFDKGMHFGVYVKRVIAGKDAKRLIGKLKVSSVDGDEISLCKVQSGGKDIKAALDAGETIVIESLD